MYCDIKKWLLKDIHAPVPGFSDHIPLHSKNDFADVIKLKILRWEILLDYPCGTQYNQKVKTEEAFSRSKGEIWRRYIAGFEHGGRGHEPLEASGTWQRQETDPLLELPNECISDNTLILAGKIHFRRLTLRTAREYIYVGLRH